MVIRQTTDFYAQAVLGRYIEYSLVFIADSGPEGFGSERLKPSVAVQQVNSISTDIKQYALNHSVRLMSHATSWGLRASDI